MKSEKLNQKLNAKGVVENQEGQYVGVELFLPEEIYVAEGVTLELYNSPGLFSGNKVLQNYNVKWTCAIGKNMQRKFSITGTGVILSENIL